MNSFTYASVMAATCKECAERFKTKSMTAEFCGTKCRNDYNNRRASRGIVAYDCIMTAIHAPGKSVTMWRHLRKLAKEWKAEDVAKRNGFQSWRDPGARLERREGRI